jgi:hypothetical protein
LEIQLFEAQEIFSVVREVSSGEKLVSRIIGSIHVKPSI